MGDFLLMGSLLFEELIFAVDFGERGYSLEQIKQRNIFFLNFFPLAMSENLVIFLFSKRAIGHINILIIQAGTFRHMLLINLNQRLVVQLILLKHNNRPVRTRVLKVRRVVPLHIQLGLVLSREPVAQPRLVDVLRLGQLLPQLLDLLAQRLVVLNCALIHLHLHLEDLRTLGEH